MDFGDIRIKSITPQINRRLKAVFSLESEWICHVGKGFGIPALAESLRDRTGRLNGVS
jgi:hypothetical protein